MCIQNNDKFKQREKERNQINLSGCAWTLKICILVHS